ncbi:MAG: bifunctional adenosylcobinamide kinase/adenosylcobinamide-phosphate guanylyltransferase [Oscillospiraceae bacterium]|nr:bifunctional adenosylcobinamide kinase/adenosylcobinamide-phosphate guanylyltransferase [Oscillospiraceae bacterium]
MRIFISGGCKNGKSMTAQRIAKAMSGGGTLYYVATMLSRDAEDDERIERHRRERDGWGFTTVEQPTDIGELAEKCDTGAVFLLDSLTALLANEMFRDGDVNMDAADKIIAGTDRLLDAVPHIVIVSDYIYSDAVRYDPLTELYRKSLARIDRAVAARCDTVIEIAFSASVVHKGGIGGLRL